MNRVLDLQPFVPFGGITDDGGSADPSFGQLGIRAFPPFGGEAEISPPPPVNDSAIYAEIMRRLTATGRFARVAYADEPEIKGKAANLTSLAIVIPGPGDEADGWDDPEWSQSVRKVSWTLEIRVREKDPVERDAIVGRLMASARKAIDRQSLLGVTVTEQTRLRGDKPTTATPPERRQAMTGQFWYFIDGDYRDDDVDGID